MKLNDRVVQIAQEQLGVHEATHQNDGIPSTRYCGGRREPWCAHFVAWCFREAGHALPGDVLPTPERMNPIALVARMEGELRRMGWLYREPLPGDIVFFLGRENSDAGRGRHVGIVEATSLTTVHTIEGNSSDGVHRRTRMRHKLMQAASSFGRIPEPEGPQ